MDLNSKKMTCINCSCSVTTIEGNNTENLNLFLISVFGNVLHSNSMALNDITICNNCNSYANKLWNYRNRFLKQTNPESKISRITQQDRKVKKFFGLDKDVEMPNFIKEEFITCDSETPCQAQKEIIAPKTESDSYEQGVSEETVKHDVEEIVKREVEEIITISDIYDEKILELKINKFQLSELLQKSLPKTVNAVHSCDKCSRNFASQEKLENHLESAHTSVGYNFSCQFCKKPFSYYWFYKNHLKVNHGGVEMTFSCSICRENVHSQKELDQHNFSVHQMTSHPFKCNFCDVAFETVEEMEKLRSHLVESHGDSKEAEAARVNLDYIMEKQKWSRKTWNWKPCDICGKFLQDTLTRTIHILFEHQDHRSCQICKLNFDSENDFYDHIQSGHPLHTCAVCGKRLSSPNSLLKHLQDVHLIKLFRFSCEICASSFNKFDRLQNHYKYHSVKASPRQFSCHQCGKLFTLKQQLQYHVATHSLKNNETDELLKCKYCEETFEGSRRKNYLRKHIYRFHTEELKKETDSAFKCLEPECGLKFSTAQGLHLHTRRHNYGLSVTSGPITPGDQSSQNLIKQLVIDGVRKFQCGVCEILISTKNHLHRHLFRKHDLKFDSIKYDTLENVKCEVCGKTFKDKYKLKRHRAAFHEDKPGHVDESSNNVFKVVVIDNVKKFQCGLCETVVSRRCHLHRHLFRQHAVKFKSIKYNTMEKAKCDICGKIMKDKYRLKNHMSTFHQGNLAPGDKNYLQQYKCTLCDAICIATSGIRDHFLTSHPDSPGANAAANNVKRVEEDISMGIKACDWTLVQNGSTAKIENYCKPCNNLFPTISDKYAHDCQHHKTFLKCKTCKGVFGNENNLKKHQFSHSSLNCHYCVSVFDCVENYYEHLQTKHTLQPYICEFCGLFFSTKQRIRSHYREHINNQSVTGSSKDKSDQPKKLMEKKQKSEPNSSNTRRSGRIPHKRSAAYDSTDSDTSISDSSYSEYSN